MYRNLLEADPPSLLALLYFIGVGSGHYTEEDKVETHLHISVYHHSMEACRD
ncbi:hypothetical protein F2Q70_00033985 [Brassica cretica]|uniref:Uncharacterized protein n=1 Tax=Brassica cretica TaxID=69181 RepID=A0A8S9JYT3_BRACR|nr:hypothetical protein F2Q70_00033985 [Brassica cretica]